MSEDKEEKIHEMMGSVDRSLMRKLRIGGRLKLCPCGHYTVKDAQKCWHCGKEFQMKKKGGD